MVAQCQIAGVSFDGLAREALDAHPEAVGEDDADRLTVALCLRYIDTTGEEPDMTIWRRAPEHIVDEDERARRTTKWAKHAETVRQMKARSGLYYDRSRSLSKLVSAAWMQAGSPRHVCRTWGKPPTYWIRTGGREIQVGEDDWIAWDAWVRERERLRQELGVNRSWSSKVPRR